PSARCWCASCWCSSSARSSPHEPVERHARADRSAPDSPRGHRDGRGGLVALRTGRVYWRPAGASRRALVGIALLSVVALFVGETTRWSVPQADYDAKFEAAQRAQEAFEVIRRARLRRGPPIDPVSDPTESGLIGLQ